MSAKVRIKINPTDICYLFQIRYVTGSELSFTGNTLMWWYRPVVLIKGTQPSACGVVMLGKRRGTFPHPFVLMLTTGLF